VANAYKSFRQGMQQKAPDKLDSRKMHDTLAGSALVVFIPKGDLAVLQRAQALVGDRHPVSIAGQVGQYLSGGAKSRVGIDHPLEAGESPQEGFPLVEIGQLVESACQPELPVLPGPA